MDHLERIRNVLIAISITFLVGVLVVSLMCYVVNVDSHSPAPTFVASAGIQ
jgi:hypothetical protein